MAHTGESLGWGEQRHSSLPRGDGMRVCTVGTSGDRDICCPCVCRPVWGFQVETVSSHRLTPFLLAVNSSPPHVRSHADWRTSKGQPGQDCVTGRCGSPLQGDQGPAGGAGPGRMESCEQGDGSNGAAGGPCSRPGAGAALTQPRQRAGRQGAVISQVRLRPQALTEWRKLRFPAQA